MSEIVSFGEWVKQRRRALDLTQAALAERAGCASITLQKIELDERRPSLPMAERLADFLQIPVAERTAFIRRARGLSVRGEAMPASPADAKRAVAAQPVDLPFVGREPALSLLTEAWQQVRRRQTRVLLLVGESGMGKTRLVTEFLRQPALSSLVTIQGGPTRWAGDCPSNRSSRGCEPQ